MTRVNLLSILFISLLIFACKGDDETLPLTTPIEANGSQTEKYNPQQDIITASLVVTVVDESESAIVNATIIHEGKQFVTDENGIFVIANESFDKNGTFFTVEKTGYFKGSRRLYPQEGSINYATILLMELNDIGQFDASNGGNVVGTDDIEISFPENSIQDDNGTLYTGQVTVAAKWLDPTAPNIGTIMPGDLLGLNADAQEMSLVSYGMMAVELFGNNEEPLNLAPGKEATLSFPVPNTLLNSAPQEIPLWSFEEEDFGIWVQEGTARLEGDKYVGQVSHFSFWNCDVPYDLVEIKGQLLIDDITPLANATVTVQVNNTSNSAYGYTDAGGFFSGKMPKGQELTLQVGYLNDACDFQDVNLGSFENDSDVGAITLQSSGSPFTITGSAVDCEGLPITNGLVKIQTGDNETIYYLENQSSFEIGMINCNDLSEVSIEIINIDDRIASQSFTMPIEDMVDFDQVQVCENTVEEFFTFTVNGESATVFDGIEVHVDGKIIDIETSMFYMTFIDFPEIIGTYDASDFVYLDLGAIPPLVPEFLGATCNNSENCEGKIELEFNVVTNEGIGGIMEGNFSGIAKPSNSETFFDFSGEYRILYVD